MTAYADPDYRAEQLLDLVGLTGYQAKLLIALIDHDGPADSATIAARAGVPRTSIYKAAGELADMGLVTATNRDAGDVRTVARWEADGWQVTCSRLRAHLQRNYDERVGAVDELDRAR